jgi:hypothetical protein
MKILLKIFFVLLFIVFGAIATTTILSMITSYSYGWDGIAGVLGGLMTGAVIGLVLSLLLLRTISDKRLPLWILSLLLLNAALVLFLGMRADQRRVKSQYLERIDNGKIKF